MGGLRKTGDPNIDPEIVGFPDYMDPSKVPQFRNHHISLRRTQSETSKRRWSPSDAWIDQLMHSLEGFMEFRVLGFGFRV